MMMIGYMNEDTIQLNVILAKQKKVLPSISDTDLGETDRHRKHTST